MTEAKKISAKYIQLAELEIDPRHLDDYKIALKEHIETAIRSEPGVLVLYAVEHEDEPARITIFEVYRHANAFQEHLEEPHFKKYKAVTERMVRSLKLVPATPILLRAKESAE
ncbi:MAG: antibiotic biosynthesis monooxygenase [Hyphomicrobiales bacterium]|nr:antibiotic biosynthesis monooxygenase [Hyphomicrobiales bacterium]